MSRAAARDRPGCSEPMTVPCERRVLDNGLRVVLAPEPRAHAVAVNLWYAAGSRHELPGRTGLAHLCEHLMFQGSAHVPKNGHFEHLESIGGSCNATTWFDRTNYYAVVPPEHLELVLWLESDRMGWLLPGLDQTKLDNQREVVASEKREHYDNQPYGDWVERMLPMLYPPDHPYAHPVIGSLEDIASASLADVAGFFGDHYRPGNAVLAVVGRFDRDRALDLVETYFGEIPRGCRSATGISVPTALPDGGRSLAIEADVPLPRAFVAHRSLSLTDPGFATVEVATALLGSGRAARLPRSLVRERRLARSVSAHVLPLAADVSPVIASATGVRDTDPEELALALMEEIEGLAEVGSEEIDRALAMCESSLLRSLERVAGRADLLSFFETFFGDPSLIDRELERLREVTARDVKDLVADAFSEGNRVVLTYRPREEG